MFFQLQYVLETCWFQMPPCGSFCLLSSLSKLKIMKDPSSLDGNGTIEIMVIKASLVKHYYRVMSLILTWCPIEILTINDPTRSGMLKIHQS